MGLPLPTFIFRNYEIGPQYYAQASAEGSFDLAGPKTH